MTVTLDAPRLACVKGFAKIAAVVEEPGRLHVEIFGTEKCVRHINSMLMTGPVDGELAGKPIRMRHFYVLNHGDRRRVVMDVQYEERDLHSADQLTRHRQDPANE